MNASATAAERGLDTFPKLLLRNAKQWADRPAIRLKYLGIWQSWTWAQVLDEVRAFAIGLKKLGITKGDKVAIIGANRPRLYWTFAAAQSLGAIPVPIYQDAVADEMVFVLQHAEVVCAVVEDQEQVDKVLSVSDQLPDLRFMAYDEDRGLRDYDHTHLHSFEDVQAQGREEMAQNGSAVADWEKCCGETAGADISVMLYTSGTTGQPKGVMLSFDNLVISARNGNAFD
ncbi:MAG: AMP-binding protein, partial [Rhodobiaceae bacterium]|nr:AMP-binding protein [Rhodobiaceae bacterium]